MSNIKDELLEKLTKQTPVSRLGFDTSKMNLRQKKKFADACDDFVYGHNFFLLEDAQYMPETKKNAIGFAEWIPTNRWAWNDHLKLWERFVSHAPNDQVTSDQLYQLYLSH